MTRTLALVSTTLLCLDTARGEPFWATFIGDDWPENQGWTHAPSDPPALRWLEGGRLFIDSRAAWYMGDIYRQTRAGQFALAPDELFVAVWGIQVDEVVGYEDPGVYVQADGYYELKLDLALDLIFSAFEPGTSATFAPGDFHEFRLESPDMRTYSVYIDGTLGFTGAFFWAPVYLGDDGIGWGDMASAKSLAEWAYFDYGIVPSTSAALGDLDCDGAVDVFDIDPFVAALTNPSEYYATAPGCDAMLADINQDGRVDVFDIDPFVDLLLGGYKSEAGSP